MFIFLVAENNSRMVLELSINGKKIGYATLDNDPDILHLRWIEIEDNYKSQGMGKLMLGYITDNILKNNQVFHISVVNEDVLPFYISFFENKEFKKETIFDWIQDGDIHPEIYVGEGILTNKPIIKLKRSL